MYNMRVSSQNTSSTVTLLATKAANTNNSFRYNFTSSYKYVIVTSVVYDSQSAVNNVTTDATVASSTVIENSTNRKSKTYVLSNVISGQYVNIQYDWHTGIAIYGINGRDCSTLYTSVAPSYQWSGISANSGSSTSQTLTLSVGYKEAYIFAASSDYRNGTGFSLIANNGTLSSVTNGYNGAFGSYLRYVIYKIDNAPAGTVITYRATNGENYGHGIAIGICGITS